jgi:hypothetical protein
MLRVADVELLLRFSLKHSLPQREIRGMNVIRWQASLMSWNPILCVECWVVYEPKLVFNVI